MVIDPWFLLQAAELADQTLTHLSTAAAALNQELHLLDGPHMWLEDITDNAAWFSSGINGGCAET